MRKTDAQQIANALLPCPFCGVRPAVTIRGFEDKATNPKARCITEGCAGSKLPVMCLDVPQQVAAWNHRAPQQGETK